MDELPQDDASDLRRRAQQIRTIAGWVSRRAPRDELLKEAERLEATAQRRERAEQEPRPV
jgi:hypothetical protein